MDAVIHDILEEGFVPLQDVNRIKEEKNYFRPCSSCSEIEDVAVRALQKIKEITNSRDSFEDSKTPRIKRRKHEEKKTEQPYEMVIQKEQVIAAQQKLYEALQERVAKLENQVNSLAGNLKRKHQDNN